LVVVPKEIAVLGAGLSGLASAALLAKAGHKVTVFEANDWVGGKSRRIEVLGQRMDTGPALVTFTSVWNKLLETFDAMPGVQSRDVIDLKFVKLSELGRYFYKDNVSDLPVAKGQPWFDAWERFSNQHGNLLEPIGELLTKSPMDMGALPSLAKLQKTYGLRLTTKSYLKGLRYLPDDLRDVIAIHTLNAGVSPRKTLALYASITAVMATDGIRVPVGGVNEIAQSLHKLAVAAGAEVLLGQRITLVKKTQITTDSQTKEFDLVVSSLDPEVLKVLMGGKVSKRQRLRSCSGVAIYAVLKKPLPENTVTHSVVMPDDPAELYESIEAARVPKQTMAFVNYYKPGEIYPNQKPTVALLLTAPADGKSYDIESPWVKTELERISKMMGLEQNIVELIEAHEVLDPEYFAMKGSPMGALYGATRPLWQAGPFHIPGHHNLLRPWLYRVGASVHPGGGIPAVLGSAQNVVGKILRRLP
jgi:phytoene desaturase